MHDIDRTQLESDYEAYESDFEFAFEGESEFYGEADSPFSEAEEMEFAVELLEVTDEAELDYFLGSLIKRGAQAVGKFIKSPTGKALGGLLKGAAKKALPMVGKAVGTYFGGPAGGAIGGKLASGAGKLFGLELEGLTGEDQEFEVARQIVRLAGTAAKKAAMAPPSAPPQAAARSAFASAAKQFAPGLIGSAAGVATGSGRSGRWVRRGRKIILYGV
ncbi:MAG: hypothetical protein L0229_15795 [Blastocatellia bacterium]|nr:hypothetical protein [Blastocatellia bacterium]